MHIRLSAGAGHKTFPMIKKREVCTNSFYAPPIYLCKKALGEGVKEKLPFNGAETSGRLGFKVSGHLHWLVGLREEERERDTQTQRDR